MNARGPRRAGGMGASSLLMILVILCLTTLGVLALTSALAEYRLSARTAQNSAAYYEASANAQEELALLDQTLARLRMDSADAADYEARKADSGLEFTDADRSLYEILEPLGDGRVLCVRVEVLPLESDARYRMRGYSVRDEREWEAEAPKLLQ